jgi:hypothetical protein
MNTAAELRKQIEAALAERIPAALSIHPATAPELVSCGIAEVDAALQPESAPMDMREQSYLPPSLRDLP